MLWFLFNILFFTMVTPSFAQYTYSFGTYTRYIEGSEIRNIAIEGKYIWCASDNGVVRYDKQSGQIIRYTIEDGLCQTGVRSIAVDHDKVTWAGTHSNGLRKGGVSRYDGVSWSTVIFPEHAFEYDTVWSIAVDRNNTKWFCSEEHVISFDGVNFSATKIGGGNCVFPDSKNTIWVGGGSLLHFNGTEWEEIENSSPYTPYYCAIGDDRHGVIWFGYDMGLKSFDGTNWVIYEDVGIHVVTAIAVDKNNVKWLGTEFGIWSFDGKTWKWYDGGEGVEGTEFYPVIDDIEIDSDGVIWIAAYHDGLMTFSPDTGAGVNQSHKPEKIQIMNVSPNPFNTSTTISFTIPSSCHAALAVYSLTGQRVRTLVSGPLSAGSHSAFWDGHDDSGRLVSSGVYLFRIEADGKNAAGKMLFLK